MQEPKLSFVVDLEGNAAAMVIQKIADLRMNNNVKIGQSRAAQLLLCELYNARKLNKDIKPCEE